MKRIFFLVIYLAPLLCLAQLENETLYTNLKKALEEPEKVIRLKLSKEKLKAVPPEVFLFPNLKELELRGILFSEEEHQRLKKLLPNAKVNLSPSCQCEF